MGRGQLRLAPFFMAIHNGLRPCSSRMGLSNQGKTPGRTTLLEAVCICLESIGEAPVSTLDNEQIGDARLAERTLLEFHKAGQAEGWHWNSETAYPFAKDQTTGEIVVPANAIKFAPNLYLDGRRFILRGQRLYDTWERTYKLTDEIQEVQADVVWMLDWDECPEVFNRWITVKSARVFAARALGDKDTVQYTAMDERDARAELEAIEHETAGYNILTDGPGLRPFPTYVPAMGLVTRRLGAGLRL